MTPTIHSELRFFFAVIVTSFIVWLILAGSQQLSTPSIEPISEGRYSAASGLENAQQKKLDGSAENVELMHVFPVHKMQPTYGTYWFELADTCPEETCSVFIPRLSLSAEVYFNQQFIGRTGSVATPIANSAFRPYLFDIPKALFLNREPGEKNILKIVLASEFLERGRIWPFYFSEKSNLDPVYELSYFLHVSLPMAIAALLLFGFILAVMIWVLGVRDKLYLWFALLIAFSALSNFSFHWVEFPYSTELRQNLYTFSGFGAMICLPPLLHRFYHHRVRVVEYFTLYYSLLSLCAVAYLMTINNTDRHFIRALLLTPSFALLCLYEIGYLIWHRRDIVDKHLLTTAVALIVFAEMRLYDIHNIMTFGHWLTPLSRIAAPLTLLVFIAFFLRSFIQYYRESLTTKLTLDRKIAEREQELAEKQNEVLELRKHQTLQDERQRIMREMHDGAGGLLVSLILQAKSKRFDQDLIVDQLKQTLTHIRLMVDSLDTIDESLSTALGMFRVRIEPLFQTAGIDLAWQMRFENDHCSLNPEGTLHVFRILQEACTNAIKHSNADLVTIRSEQNTSEKIVDIWIEDNGKAPHKKLVDGDKSHFENNGKGLKNMVFRAEKISATIGFKTTSTGYSVHLAVHY